MTVDCVIKVRNLNKRFGSCIIFDNISFDIFKGESVSVLGASGSGKSLLLKCILGITSLDSGFISINGIDVNNFDFKGIGMLFQESALFNNIPVWENIMFSYILSGKVGYNDARLLSMKKLLDIGLPCDVVDLYPTDLSVGMRKCIAFMRLIVSEPKIVFFDEPTSGLDPVTSSVMRKLILKYISNVTTILVTHDIHNVWSMSSRVFILFDGELICCSNLEEVKVYYFYIKKICCNKKKGLLLK